jgi:hypothetical protein
MHTVSIVNNHFINLEYKYTMSIDKVNIHVSSIQYRFDIKRGHLMEQR